MCSFDRFEYVLPLQIEINTMSKLIQLSLLVLLSMPVLAQIPNANFEEERPQPGIKNWGAIILLQFPNPCDSTMPTKGFYFLNDEPHSGKHALELNNGYCGDMHYAGRAHLIESDTEYATFATGVPYTGRPNYFTFFYKFIQGGEDLPPGTDTAVARLVLSNLEEGVDVGSATLYISRTTQGYEEAIIPIVYESSLPVTSAYIEFSNITGTSTATYGTRFLIDDIDLRNTISSVKENKGSAVHISCSPNPATNSITFSSNDGARKTLTIYSIDGKQVHQTSLLHKVTVDCSKFSKGSYVYQVDGVSGQFIVN
jgi:hypothetical protein